MWDNRAISDSLWVIMEYLKQRLSLGVDKVRTKVYGVGLTWGGGGGDDSKVVTVLLGIILTQELGLGLDNKYIILWKKCTPDLDCLAVSAQNMSFRVHWPLLAHSRAEKVYVCYFIMLKLHSQKSTDPIIDFQLFCWFLHHKTLCQINM